MAKRVKRHQDSSQKDIIFMRLRKRIAERLADPMLKGRKNVSSLEAAIGTFAPSEYIDGFKLSDFPFIGSRYISLKDGCVYIVAGSTDDGENVMAYRIGFIQSNFTHRGGIAVGISEDAWIDGIMIMYSLEHAAFNMENGELKEINSDFVSRRSYPMKKLRVYLAYLKNTYIRVKKTDVANAAPGAASAAKK